LDALIAKLKSSDESRLVVEHLQTAHAYLHGAMPNECTHNLELARDAADTLPSKPLAAEVKGTIGGLLHDLHPAAPGRAPHHVRTGVPQQESPSAPAKGLGRLFQGDDVSLGIFYPKKHVVAVFPTFERAEVGLGALSAAGFRMWEAIAVPGVEVARFLEELRLHQSLWSSLMTEFSRLLDTEAALVDRYGEWARQGAGFLVAYSPAQADAEGIAELIKPLDPQALHWFMPGYIQHLR
jgi:hypothetical protein